MRISWSIGATIYFYLKCVVYDKLLKPRQSFWITLYIGQGCLCARFWRCEVFLVSLSSDSIRSFKRKKVEGNLVFGAEVEVGRYAAIDTQQSWNVEWITCHIYISDFHRFYFTRSFYTVALNFASCIFCFEQDGKVGCRRSCSDVPTYLNKLG
jgi:hypothetical protein